MGRPHCSTDESAWASGWGKPRQKPCLWPARKRCVLQPACLSRRHQTEPDQLELPAITAKHWSGIELVNHAGVAKKIDQPAATDPAAVARVVIRPKFRCVSAREWRSNRSYPQPGEIALEVAPGRSVFLELSLP